MNTTIKLAVASALLAAASTASAGIIIPAGDWTVDISGNVNAYYTSTRTTQNAQFNGGAATRETTSNITTGLLPNFMSIGGKTRENDLDVAFAISFNPGASQSHSASGGSQSEQRQAYLTFGDKSWGSIKLGKDLGIYGSDAILSDMTLLGVGQGAAGVGTTTLGRIGAGYMYADWKSQIAYTSPNWNGFSFTAGVTQSWNAVDGQAGTNLAGNSASSTKRGGSEPAFEGKVSYEWAGDVAGKVWASALSQKVKGMQVQTGSSTFAPLSDARANAWDIGATVNVAGFGLTGYYGQGRGTGTTFLLSNGFDAAGQKRDSDDWYVQGTYVIPGVGTKLGVSYGESNLDATTADKLNNIGDYSNQMWTIGAYHPLTKHLNLVAEYSDVKKTLDIVGGSSAESKAKTVSLGAILFF